MNSNIWTGKHGPLLIAEIGGNHEGDFEYAKELTSLAIESGCDYVKFQIYTGDGLVNPVEGEVRNKHFKKFELSQDQHIELAQLCKENNVGYLASVWEESAFEWIDPYLDFYKIGSGDLTAYPILKSTASLRKPILLSTGLANEQEVLSCIDFIKSCDSFYEDTNNIAVLQCTSMYPIPNADANLRVMSQLRQLTGCAIGYSDHTEGSKALEMAVALGAQILEFHFTDSRENKTFRDHKVSLTKNEVQDLIHEIKNIKELLGSSEKKPLEIEGEHITSFRRAVYPRADIPENTVITEEHLITLRPNHGIPATDFYDLIGKKTKTNLLRLQKLDWSYFE